MQYDYMKGNSGGGYTPKSDLNEITWLKEVYTKGSDEDKAWAANEAQKHYGNLRENGYGYLADQYANMSHADAFNAYKTSYDREGDYIVTDADYQKTLDNYRNNLNKAADIAAESNMAYYDNMYDGINRKYDDTSKAMQLGYMRDSANLNNQLAVSGITGGMSESARLAAMSGYQGNLYQNEAERNDYLNQLEFEKAQIERDKNAQYVQNELAATEYARRAMESDRAYQMQQEQFDRTMKYNYNNMYLDNMRSERSHNEDVRRWNIQNGRAAEEHGVFSRSNQHQRWFSDINFRSVCVKILGNTKVFPAFLP